MTTDSSKRMSIAVVGGGAAGFFAAISAAEAAPQSRVTILEKSLSVLAKVRISGGGRCNVTHSCFEPKTLTGHYPRGNKALLGPFHKFQPLNTTAWFESHGVQLKTESDGRIFPKSDNSQTIIDALTGAARNAFVDVQTGIQISRLAQDPEGKFIVEYKSGERSLFDRLIIATGSHHQGYKWAASFGHTIVPPVPSLFTFTIPDSRLRALSGVAVPDASVQIKGTALKQKGPLLITHWGLSGPAILKLSAWGARELNNVQYRAPIIVNWINQEFVPVVEALKSLRAHHTKKNIVGLPPFKLPRRLWEYLLQKSEISNTIRWADLGNAQLEKMSHNLCSCPYQIEGKSAFKDEFVTAGGINLDEINFKTMESRLVPHLYFAGEILDIDGVTGGFNFQNAWTTGWLAGRAAA